MGCTPSKDRRRDSSGGPSPVPADNPRPSGDSIGPWSLLPVGDYMRETSKETLFGSMRLSIKTMQVLLVFPKAEDAQGNTFQQACERRSYKYHLSRNASSALETFINQQSDLVIIDCRQSDFEAEKLCRAMRCASKHGEYAVILALTDHVDRNASIPSVLPLLTAGFNRAFSEIINVDACLNELVTLEMGEVRNMWRLMAASAVFVALENTEDAVQITNENHEIQYVNASFEKMCGFRREDVLGKDERNLLHSDKNGADIFNAIDSNINRGTMWEGVYHVKRREGESLPCRSRVSPAGTSSIRHLVTVRNQSADVPSPYDTIFHPPSPDVLKYLDNIWRKTKRPSDVTSISRRPSVQRIHSMIIKTPIYQVISLINEVKENTPDEIHRCLQQIYDILTNPENVFCPNGIPDKILEDRHTRELFTGLTGFGIEKESNNSHEEPPHRLQSSDSRDRTLSAPAILLSDAANEQMGLLLQQATSWEFSIIEMERLSNKKPLYHLGMNIFERFRVREFLNCTDEMLGQWLNLVESHYHANNPYHNSTHAADVLQATAYFLECSRVQAILTPMDKVAALLAAAVHDVDHPGRNNAFLCNSNDPLALLYNDVSVLESHHVSFAFQVTMEKVNIFNELPREDYRSLRQTIIDMVLATDMSHHFEHVSKFNNAILGRLEDEHSTVGGQSGDSDSALIARLAQQPDSRRVIKRILIKAADINNPARPQALCREWTNRIAQEYFQQTDEEKKRSLPVVMPIFERHSCNIPKSQVGFIDYFVRDMFEAWDTFATVPTIIKHLNENYAYWNERALHQNQTEENSVSTQSPMNSESPANDAPASSEPSGAVTFTTGPSS